MASQTMTEMIPLEPTLHMKLGNGPQPPQKGKPGNTMRMRNLKLDPTRALEPARKKLSTIESQRIMAVFEETIKRAQIVTALPYISENMDRFRIALGNELMDMIKQHNRITLSYKEIRRSLDELLEKRAKKLAQLNAPEEEEEEKEEEAPEETNLPKGYSFSSLGEEEAEYEAENEEEAEEGKDEVDEDAADQDPTQPQEPEAEEGPDAAIVESKSAKTSSVSDVSENIEKMVSQEERRDSACSIRSTASELNPRIEESMRNLGLVAQQVSHSCKNILRLFASNPAAMKLLKNETKCRTAGGQSVVDNMIELRDILMNKLLTTPEEESERMSYLEDISKRERHNAAIIEKQEAELKLALDDKEAEIQKKNEVIKRLQTDLHQIEKFSDENIRRTRAEAEKQEIADAKNSDQKTQKLQTEINQLQTQLNNAIAEHRESEAELRGKKYKVENEVDNWIQKYDQDLGERQDEYEEIDLVYTEEKKQLFELEERFATLEKEYMAIMEERRVARDKRERAQRELALLVKAATTIQAFWRSYKVRKALKAKNKKKGGKKGKK